jgi:hypothetical protein
MLVAGESRYIEDIDFIVKFTFQQRFQSNEVNMFFCQPSEPQIPVNMLCQAFTFAIAVGSCDERLLDQDSSSSLLLRNAGP